MCTSFAVYSQNNPIYGMNFDSDDIDLKLNIYNYADSDVFYFSGLMDNIYRDIAGINSNDLFICTQALEYSPNFQPCSNGNNVFAFDVIEESFNMGLHTIIADKYGDAVILEEEINTNVISKIDGKFIVMTNFPNGNFKNQKFDEVYGCGADRYIKAYKNINDKKWKVSIKEKTIHSLNGFNNNNSIIFTTEGVSVKQLYKFYE